MVVILVLKQNPEIFENSTSFIKAIIILLLMSHLLRIIRSPIYWPKLQQNRLGRGRSLIGKYKIIEEDKL
jgi:hypothetical protein